MNIEIKELKGKFEIEHQGDRELVTLTVDADIISDKARVVAAGADVDGLEVLPSVRIELIDGETTKTFPPIKIFRQLIEGKSITRDYKITVAIGSGADLHAVNDLFITM